MNLFSYGANNPVRFVDADGLDPYIHPYVSKNIDLIKIAAERHGIPPEVLCATIATELRSGEMARQYQKNKNLPAAVFNIVTGEGLGSTSLGPGQVSVDASLEAGGAGSNVLQEFARLHFLESYAVDRSAAYLDHLVQQNRHGSGFSVGPFTDEQWARVISGYNTGDVTSNRGGYGPLYEKGQYSKDIEARLDACRKLLNDCE